MDSSRALAHLLNLRQNEARAAAIAFFSCLLCVFFLILGSALRDSLYFTSFKVETLPYVTGGVVLLGLPFSALLTRLYSKHHPLVVFKRILILIPAGLVLLWPWLDRSRVAVALFYLFFTLTAAMLMSGFWGSLSELFGIRGAKRLYGLISIGGSLGALMAGAALHFLASRIAITGFVPILLGCLVFAALIQCLNRVPEEASAPIDEEAPRSSIRESIRLIGKDPHLRTMVGIVMAASSASVILDFQFMEWVTAAYPSRSELASFLGTFEAVTSVSQILFLLWLTPRLLQWAGVTWSLAVLPLVLLFGSVGFFLLPSLAWITIYGGMDYALRKAIHRPMLEVLFVPLPTMLRRKTKSIVDSVLDSLAEGLGALVVFAWITVGQFPSRYLSLFIAGLAVLLLGLSRQMGLQYFQSLIQRIREGKRFSQQWIEQAGRNFRDLWGSTFTHLDLAALFQGMESAIPLVPPLENRGSPGISQSRLPAGLLLSDPARIERGLQQEPTLAELPWIIPLLAQDAFRDRVTERLLALGSAAAPALIQVFAHPDTEFAIRRRIPKILAQVGEIESDEALLNGLAFPRFEVRYRSAVALVQREKLGLPATAWKREERIWEAIRREIARRKPLWEMQSLVDRGEEEDCFISERLKIKGSLSLEHTFRLLALVLDFDLIGIAYRGIVLDQASLKNFALEYLEQVLPAEVRNGLWPFIGDISEYQRQKQGRDLEEVVAELRKAETSLFLDAQDRETILQIMKLRRQQAWGGAI